jgi:small conductance mechanosensitive channel
MSLMQLASPVAVERWDLKALVLDWRLDAMTFLRHDLPKIIFIICVSFVLIRVLRIFTARLATMQARRLPPGLRTQQVKTVVGVINSVAVFVIVFVSVLMILAELNLHLEPLLASAGVAGIAIGFGAQTLVHDFINGFYIVLENQYDIGDSIRVAGVKGSVEEMTLRHTVLRDDDGTLHTVPNSAIQIVSNMTRDWSQLTLRVTAAYGESSDKVVALLGEIGTEIRHDPAYADDIVSDIQVPGIDKVSNGEVEYLMIVKTKPNRQYGVSRELRRRIKDRFHKENIRTAEPGKVYVVDQAAQAS